MKRLGAAMLLCSIALLTACDRGSQGAADTASRARAGDTGRAAGERYAAAARRPESEVDQELTLSIRQAIMDDDTLSPTAKNTSVVTLDGVVTLRGRANSSDEKQAIAAIARSVPGVKRVDDQVGVALR